MSYAIADLDAEAEVLLTRAEWFDTRKKYLALAGRDDALYPPPVPAGYAWARKVTGVVNVDPLPQSVILARGQTETPRTTIRWRLVYGDPASDAVYPTAEVVASTTSPADRTIAPRPASDLVTTQVYSRSSPPYFVGKPEEWVGRYVANGLRGPVALPRAVASYDSSAWRDTPWGRQLAYAFLPTTAVSGPFVVGPSDIKTFGGPLDTDVVLVRSPHPYLPASAIERQRVGPDVTTGAGGPNAHTVTPVHSRGMSWVRGPGHAPRSTPDGWTGLLYRQQSAGAIPAGIRVVTDAVGGALQNVASSVSGAARNLGKFVTTGDVDALQALAAAALTVAVTGGLGLGVVGTVLNASSVAGSDDPWRAAARVGAVHWAFAISPLTQYARQAAGGGSLVEPYGGSVTAAESLGAVRGGASEITAKTYSVGGMTVTADDIDAAEVWALRLQVASPAEVNAALQWLALQGGYIDLIFTRLTIEAEQNAAKRAALKADVAVKAAAWWRDYGQYIALAAGVIMSILSLGTLAPEAAAGFALLKTLYTLGIKAQQMEVALDAQRRAELEADRMVREIEAEIARLEAELAAQGTTALPGVPAPAGTDAPVGQSVSVSSAAVSGYRAWYAPIVDYWRGHKS